MHILYAAFSPLCRNQLSLYAHGIQQRVQGHASKTMQMCTQAGSDGDLTPLPPLMPAMQSALQVLDGLFDPALQLSKQVPLM